MPLLVIILASIIISVRLELITGFIVWKALMIVYCLESPYDCYDSEREENVIKL